MLMVVGYLCPAARTGGLPYGMRVIEPHQPLVLISVQCHRIIEPMGPFLSCNHQLRFELDPIPAFFVDHQNLAIEIEERIQAGIALTRPPLLHVITG